MDNKTAETQKPVKTRRQEPLRTGGTAVNVRFCKDGRYRLRFYHVARSQLSVVHRALAQARHDVDTDSDTRALEAICASYLAHVNEL